MKEAEHLDAEFSGFFDEADFVECMRDGGVVAGTGLSAYSLGSVARRQLVGSLVAACGIAAAVALMELRPVQIETTVGHAHGLFVVRNPTFASPARYDVAALKQRDIELP